MIRYLILTLLTLVLMGQSDCGPNNPPPGPENFYCAPATIVPYVEMSTLDRFLAAVTSQQPDTIIGGTPSSDRRSTVHIWTLGVGTCTGVILGDNTILTAAHCLAENVWNDPVGEIRVSLNAIYPIGWPEEDSYWTVTNHLMHPDYTPTDKKADLALLYVDKPLPPTTLLGFYSPVQSETCLALTAQGWGQTEEYPEPCLNGESICLRESDYMVDQIANGRRTLITKQRTEGGICFGDSGGPLYATVQGEHGVYLAGITSWTQTRDCKVRSGHVNVDYYASWIFDNFNGLGVRGTL